MTDDAPNPPASRPAGPIFDERGKFAPGNPGGRPNGAKGKLAGRFWKDLHDAWEEFGIDAIRATAIGKPVEFVKIVASVMPKELLARTESVVDMSDTDLEDAVEVLRQIAEKNRQEKANINTKILLGNGDVLEHSRPKDK